jgi:hypothetical protein
MKRKPVPLNKSKKIFKSTANKTHIKNLSPKPMRGGIRL